MLEELEGAVDGRDHRRVADATLDGVDIREGAYLGLVDDVAVASGHDLDAVVHEVVDRVLAGGQSFLTILTGEDAPRSTGSLTALEERHPDLEARGPRGRTAALPAPRRRSVTAAAPIRVLLVEDSDVYRDSLVFLLGTRPDVDVVAAVGDGASALARLASTSRTSSSSTTGCPTWTARSVAAELEADARRLPERLCRARTSTMPRRARALRSCARTRGSTRSFAHPRSGREVST